MNEREKHSAPFGTGPGNQTPDGCSVELYKRTPYRGELEDISEMLRGRRVLELGCGAGRLTTRLLQMDCKVTAVDNSPDMLSLLPTEVASVLSDIETLALDQHFDIALLASFVYNQPDVRVRHRFATTARRHVKDQKSFVLQVHNENLLEAVAGNTDEADGIVTQIRSFKKQDKLVSMSIQYRVGDMEWNHTFQARVLEFDQIATELSGAGFFEVEWIDKAHGWLRAT